METGRVGHWYASSGEGARCLDHYQIRRWAPQIPLDEFRGLPMWKPETLLCYMAARPSRISGEDLNEWLWAVCEHLDLDLLVAELEGQPRAVWMKTGYLADVGERPEFGEALAAAAPTNVRGLQVAITEFGLSIQAAEPSLPGISPKEERQEHAYRKQQLQQRQERQLLIGPWTIMAMSRPRMLRIASADWRRRSVPLKPIRPDSIRPGRVVRPMTASAVWLFPDPDSPMSPTASPFAISRSMPSPERTTPWWV